ncbi:G5 domain-containing protein [Schaalia sp. 19OD2882]|uniref:aggregation-promoting factor C-terminal-like domain-containing protein n=1 Tax=Schaalia sp. 19OD2882 TaxID=2794089 RepID=UPI001C1ECEFF|nr:ubiquitin-like domain-containing protein [Schaalia sp. 19OD2882]QWW20048.1 G5 domain-containing protein [Schaalia sp. 19OD2882]
MPRSLNLTPSRRVVLSTASLFTVAVLAIAGAGVVRAHDRVTLEVDGVSVPVTTWNGTTAGVLAAAGVEVGPHDLVQPEMHADLSDGDTVVVRTAHPYQVAVDGASHTVWSTAGSAEAILGDAAVLGGQVVLAADRSAERSAPIPLVDSARRVPLTVAGKISQITAAPGRDVRQVLADAGVEVSPIDRVKVGVEKGTMTIRVAKVQRGTVVEKAPVAFTEESKTSDSMFEGEKQVTTVGKAGTTATTVWHETVDGKETVRAVVATTTETAPVKQVVETGTKEATAKALVEAGIDPKATLEEKTEEDGTVSVRYRAALGTLSSAEEIRAATGGTPAAAESNNGQTPTAPTPAPQAAGDYSGSDPKAIAKGMVAARGWSDSEFQCLVVLWQRESGWNPYAENPSSGAYGIPQSLPGSKMASAGDDWRTNPATQITWGLGYIAGRYGTPCAALGHSDSVGWY